MSIMGNGHAGREHFFKSSPRKKLLKKQILERDGKYCFNCNLNNRKLELDHVVPLFAGGGWDLENLQLLCRPCHVKKTQRVDRAFIQLIQKTVERTLHNLDKLLIDPETPYLDTV